MRRIDVPHLCQVEIELRLEGGSVRELLDGADVGQEIDVEPLTVQVAGIVQDVNLDLGGSLGESRVWPDVDGGSVRLTVELNASGVDTFGG